MLKVRQERIETSQNISDLEQRIKNLQKQEETQKKKARLYREQMASMVELREKAEKDKR